MPDLSLPTFDINKAVADVNSAVTDVNDALRDVAYVAVGFGVLGFQRAQVRRVELAKQLENRLKDLESLPSTATARAEGFAKSLEGRIQPVRKQVEDGLDRIEAALPTPARGVVQSIRSAAAAQEQLFRGFAGIN